MVCCAASHRVYVFIIITTLHVGSKITTVNNLLNIFTNPNIIILFKMKDVDD